MVEARGAKRRSTVNTPRSNFNVDFSSQSGGHSLVAVILPFAIITFTITLCNDITAGEERRGAKDEGGT